MRGAVAVAAVLAATAILLWAVLWHTEATIRPNRGPAIVQLQR